MKMYHASNHQLPAGESLQTPNGVSCMDVTAGGVVYLTETPSDCARYGTVYAIEAVSAVRYIDQRAAQGLPPKNGRYTRGVWVALPEDTLILGVV